MFMGFYSCTRPKLRKYRRICRVDCNAGRLCPWDKPVSWRDLWISTSNEVLALVEEKKTLGFSTVFIDAPKDWRKEPSCRIQMPHRSCRGLTHQNSDKPPSSPKQSDSLF